MFDKTKCYICGKKEHHAKGLCNSCYAKNLKYITKKKCNICGSSNYHGKGLCKACYSKEITVPKDKEKRRKYRQENPIIEQKDKLCISCGKLGCSSKNMCKKCYMKKWSAQEIQKQKRQRWRNLHQEYEKQRKRKRYLGHKEEHNLKSRLYYKKYKVEINKKQYENKKRKLKTDEEFRLKENLSTLARMAILRGKGRKAWEIEELLGASISVVRKHLENQFEDNMSWKNYGRGGWNIDHFVPCWAFDLRNKEHQKICFHYTNLRPMWEKDNIIKKNTIPLGYDDGKKKC